MQLPDAKSHDLVSMLECASAVCTDRDKAWLSQQSSLLQTIADTAASKFEFYDCISHARLVMALARAQCVPPVAWLAEQQASMARVGTGELDSSTARDLNQVYQSWGAEPLEGGGGGGGAGSHAESCDSS